MYRQSLDAEMPLTGAALGRMFGKSDRWGRERIGEVRAELAATAVPETGKQTPETGTPPHMDLPAAAPPPPSVPASTPADAVTAAAPLILAPATKDAEVSQPVGARMVVWASFLLGIAASLAANVAHAEPGVGPRVAAGFVPLALLLAVECMTRPYWNKTGWQWGMARYGGTGLVAVVAAVMSYRHMHGLFHSYGEDVVTAALGPLAVDGLMIVAGFALLATTPQPGGGERR